MERHIQRLLNRFSWAAIVMGTLTLFLLYTQPPSHCIHTSLTPFPKSSCDTILRRNSLSPDRRVRKIFSSPRWLNTINSYAHFFRTLNATLLSNSSRVLCIYAGVGLEAMALSQIGVDDVTGIDVLDSPPLVQRADPHNLPFFDASFDLAFSSHLADALFPTRIISEMERVVRNGGACVLALNPEEDMPRVRSLFRTSTFVGAWNMKQMRPQMTQFLVMRVGRTSPPLPP